MPEITWKLYSPLTADFYPRDEDGEVDFASENFIPFTGTDLIVYEDSIREAVVRYCGWNKDFTPCSFDSGEEEHGDQINRKVLSLIPFVENVNGELVACTTMKLCEPLTHEETTELCNYLKEMYSDSWGVCLEDHEFKDKNGVLFVAFYGSNHFEFEIDKQPSAERAETTRQTSSQRQRPKMSLSELDGNIIKIRQKAYMLLHRAGQAEQAKEMEQRVQQSRDDHQAFAIIYEYIETEFSGAMQENRKKPEKKKSGDAR